MTASLMETLKEATAPLHNSAEGSRFQSLLTNGRLSQDVYADYLAQLYLLHSLLENEIRRHACLASVVVPLQYQEEFLRQDLVSMGKDTANVAALASTRQLLDLIRLCSAECPEALLGMHYVVLGSKHGGKFIAKNVQASYGLIDGAGSLYFDPYGPSFMPIWKQFKEEMNKLVLPAPTIEAICEAAGQMFKHFTLIGEEMMPRVVAAS